MQPSSSSFALLQKYFPEVQLSHETKDDFLYTPLSVSAFSSAVLQYSAQVEKSRNSFMAFSALSKLRRAIPGNAGGFLKIRNGRLSQEPITRSTSSATSCLENEDGKKEEMIKRKEVEEREAAAEARSSSAGKSSIWDDMPKFLLAGAVSTIVSRTCVAPLERIKLECIIQGSRSLTWVKTIQWIWASEGLVGFWKGNLLNLFRMVPFKSINFLCYDLYCDRLLSRGTKEISGHDRLIGGGISGIAATVLCLPLDTIRTRLVAPGGEALGGVVGCFVSMVQNEGFLSLYKGLTPALMSLGPASAVFYAVYDVLKASYLAKKLKKIGYGEKTRRRSEGEVAIRQLGAARTLVYGAIAGAVAETLTYPLEVMRRQLQLQKARRLGLAAAFARLVQREGVGSLFAGLVPSTLQVLPSAALSYLFYEMMKSILKIN